jgi:hypothetical protein
VHFSVRFGGLLCVLRVQVVAAARIPLECSGPLYVPWPRRSALGSLRAKFAQLVHYGSFKNLSPLLRCLISTACSG